MPLTPTGRWLLVSGPDYYNSLPQELERNDGLVTWSAPRRLVTGDLALLYQSSPSREFKWLFRARCEAVPNAVWGHMAWFEVLEFRAGMGFAEANADPVIRRFPKMRSRLVGSNHVVTEVVWERLAQLLVERNPEAAEVVRSWTSQIPTGTHLRIEDFEPADDYGQDPLFKHERGMEQFALDWLLRDGGRRLPRRDDGLRLRGRQDRLGPGMRADLVLVRSLASRPTLDVFELKLWTGSPAAADQVERYRSSLARQYPGWEVRGHLVAQGFSTVARRAATRMAITCWSVDEIDGAPHLAGPIDEG